MSTKTSKKESVGIGYLCAGILFLFNPIISIVDLLPDFIGLLLIYRGLFVASFATEKLRDARGLLWKLTLVTAVRVAAILFLPGKSDSFTLLLVFVFGVLEALYAIPFILRVFDGFYDLGRRFNAQSVYAPTVKMLTEKKIEADASGRKKVVRTKKESRKEMAESLKAFSILFFILKTLATILPELTALDVDYNLSENAQYGISITMFKPYFYILSVIIVLVFGIIWLVRAFRYLLGMKRDALLAEGVLSHYRMTVESDKGFVAALQMKNVLLMLLISAVALFPLQFDGVCVLPTVIFALILALALRVLARFDRLAVYGFIPAGITSVLSVIGLILQVPYFAEYDAEAARYLANAIRLYKPIRVLGTVEFVFALILFGYFVFVLCRVLKKHAALVGGPTHSPQYTAEARTADILKSVYARVAGLTVGGVAYLILRAASFTAAMYFSAVWIIQVFAAIAFCGLVIYAVSGIIDMIYERLENRY